MMSNYGDVRAALAQADIEEARDLLRDYLEAEPESAEVWYLAAQAAANDKQRRYFLEKAVEYDPLHHEAANELHKLLFPTGMPQPAPKPISEPQPQLTHALAPLANRAAAFFLDNTFLFGISMLLSRVAALLTNATSSSQAATQGVLVWMLLTSVTYVGYYGYNLTQKEGQTIGKRLMGVRVVKRNGAALTWWDVFLRCWIGYMLSASPIGLGFLWALVDEQKRGWHDIIADTLVVSAENRP